MDVFWQRASALSLCREWPRLPGVCRSRCIILTGSQQIPPWETAVHVPQALGKEGVKSWDSLWFDPTCSETQGKMPKLEAQSFSQPPVPLVGQPRISPAGSSRLLEAAVLITSLQACAPGRAICARLAQSLHCCGRLLPSGRHWRD